jgi:peroxiredoxin Q/BCP
MPFFRQNPPAPPQPDTAATLIGKRAPGFTLPDQNDKPIKLSDSKGKWVVLAFYPMDGTPG